MSEAKNEITRKAAVADVTASSAFIGGPMSRWHIPCRMTCSGELIALETHPDGKLMRWVAHAIKLQDRLVTDAQGVAFLADLEAKISHTAAVTREGLHVKALFAVSEDSNPAGSHGVALSVITDMLCLGVLS